MHGPKRSFRYRFKTQRFLGLLMLTLGTIVVVILILPFNVWMVLLGIILIIIGYKLYK